MSRELRTYQLTRPDGPRPVRLSLDRAQYSQQIMLEYLDAGRLYEAETCAYLGSVLQDGDVFLDVGAHVGWFSMFAAALVGPSGQVWSFEANAANHAHLVQHVALNEFGQVHPIHAAVGEAAAVLPMLRRADNDGGHALRPDLGTVLERLDDPAFDATWCTSLDGFFGDRNLPPVRAIKIDVEGFELRVLRGARSFLARHAVPVVIAEINHPCLAIAGTDEHELRAFMDGLGYDTLFFHPTEPRLVPLPPGEVVRTTLVLNYCFVRRTASSTAPGPAT